MSPLPAPDGVCWALPWPPALRVQGCSGLPDGSRPSTNARLVHPGAPPFGHVGWTVHDLGAQQGTLCLDVFVGKLAKLGIWRAERQFSI